MGYWEKLWSTQANKHLVLMVFSTLFWYEKVSNRTMTTKWFLFSKNHFLCPTIFIALQNISNPISCRSPTTVYGWIMNILLPTILLLHVSVCLSNINPSNLQLSVYKAQIKILYELLAKDCPSFNDVRSVTTQSELAVDLEVQRIHYQRLIKLLAECRQNNGSAVLQTTQCK